MALALLACLPALRAGFLWDDDVMTRSKLISSWDGLAKIWTPPSLAPREAHYWPLVYTSFWLEWRLWGAHPFGYHLTNILLHGLCGVLLWRVLRKLEVPGAWLGAALFVVHPVHVESVAWVIERKDVLSGALFFGAILAYLRFECGMRNAKCGISRPHSAFYALAFLLFAGALLSKSIVVGLPLVLAMVAWWRRGRLAWRDAALLAPFALLAAVVTAHDLRFGKVYCPDNIAYDYGLSWPGRVVLASQALWFYLAKLAWPHPLAQFYPKWTVNPAAAAQWLPLAAVLGVLAGLWAARRRIGREPLVAALYFVVMLGPALGFVDHGFMLYAWVADRFQYLASAAPLALAGVGMVTCFGWIEKRIQTTSTKMSAICGTAAVLALLGGMSFLRAMQFHDSVRLYSASAKVYPQAWGSHYVRGRSLLDAGQISDEALKSLETALRLQPEFFIASLLGQVQTVLHLFPQAEESFKTAIRLKPDDGYALSGYGVLLNQMGRLPEAIEYFKAAIKADPNNAKPLGGLGFALRNQKRYDEAATYLAEAVRREPDNVAFRRDLAITLTLMGNHENEAAAQWQAVLRLKPGDADALAALGQLKLNQGQPAAAAEGMKSISQ